MQNAVFPPYSSEIPCPGHSPWFPSSQKVETPVRILSPPGRSCHSTNLILLQTVAWRDRWPRNSGRFEGTGREFVLDVHGRRSPAEARRSTHGRWAGLITSHSSRPSKTYAGTPGL